MEETRCELEVGDPGGLGGDGWGSGMFVLREERARSLRSGRGWK